MADTRTAIGEEQNELQHFVVSESRDMSKDDGDMPKDTEGRSKSGTI